MQRLDVSGAVRPLYGSLGVKGLMSTSVEYMCSPCYEAASCPAVRSIPRLHQNPNFISMFTVGVIELW